MRGVAVSVLAAVLFVGLEATAGEDSPCGDPAGAMGVIEGSGYRLVFRSEPSTIGVSRPFALDLEVCSIRGVPFEGDLAVDAVMPMHQHGMNFRPSVVRIAAGSYRVEGLMFHMPGKWQLRFVLREIGRRYELISDYSLE